MHADATPASEPPTGEPASSGSAAALALAGTAALLASTCCVLPLLLVFVGISGAWIGRLHALEPYSAALAALAVAALALAAWRLFRAPSPADAACAADSGAACGTARVTARRWFWLVAVLTLIPLVVPLAAPFFY